MEPLECPRNFAFFADAVFWVFDIFEKLALPVFLYARLVLQEGIHK